MDPSSSTEIADIYGILRAGFQSLFQQCSAQLEHRPTQLHYSESVNIHLPTIEASIRFFPFFLILESSQTAGFRKAHSNQQYLTSPSVRKQLSDCDPPCDQIYGIGNVVCDNDRLFRVNLLSGIGLHFKNWNLSLLRDYYNILSW